MASILKRKRNKKTTYLVFIRRKGIKPILKSFINKLDAQKWARGIERELDQGRYIDYGEASKITLGEVMQRYIREDKHKKIKSWRMHQQHSSTVLAQCDLNHCAMNSC